MIDNNTNILIILGMHRSGTSLFTNWLHDCGLHVGDRLLGAMDSNPKGHFEDMDFMEFQDSILLENKTTWKYQYPIDITLSDHRFNEASNIVTRKNCLYQQWGWKDPRTCLFLNTWDTIIPTAKKIVVFRHFQDVVKSLIKRDKKTLNQSGSFIDKIKFYIRNIIHPYSTVYLHTWCAYNEKLIFHLKSDTETLFINTENVSNLQNHIFDHLTQKQGFALKKVDFNNIYNQNFWKKKYKNSDLKFKNKDLLERANSIWEELTSLERARFNNE